MRHWWRRRSLRFRLAAWYACGGTVLLAAFSLVVYGFVERQMGQPLDRQLKADLSTVKARLSLGPDGRLLWNGRVSVPGELWTWSDPWFEVWDDQGNLVQRQWPLDEARLDQMPFAPASGWETLSVFYVATDLRLRTLSTPWDASGRKSGWVLRVMRVHKPAAEALSALLLIIAISLPVVVTLLVVVGYLMTRHWLRPLNDMVAEAERISADDLSRRLPVANPHDELGRLSGVFNATLTRLEESFATLDRFAADASHELRTPLTTLRSVGEVALQRGRTAEEYREVIGSMLEEAQRLHALVERLLQLARTTGGAQEIRRVPVRLDQIVAECVAELGILAEDRRQHIVLDVVECTVRTDPVLFRQALQNLVDNAIKFSPPETEIRIAVQVSENTCEVTVSDQGIGIAPELRQRVTDRFFRTDFARSGGGFGLGLALTQAYMRVLGGTLEYEARQPQGSAFRLVLPGVLERPLVKAP
jgi:two-component system, OmpR family, sensor kinase